MLPCICEQPLCKIMFVSSVCIGGFFVSEFQSENLAIFLNFLHINKSYVQAVRKEKKADYYLI